MELCSASEDDSSRLARLVRLARAMAAAVVQRRHTEACINTHHGGVTRGSALSSSGSHSLGYEPQRTPP
jgi:hypothetical protein